ncbi:histone-lysine N-methyltransferase [Synchytrium endobioticum]|uniref:[histone H3]-lysine(36) N-trimethyltransferase n=1 Tax=Synchytrium endobioticum TaxID=286115 RepID=A0A507DGP9_9FUNG|nr:histone-lysine N-methyltransferase [Synchytrium endobioticum]
MANRYTEDWAKLFSFIGDNHFLGGANGKHGQDEIMVCFCSYDPAYPDSACGESSDCINRQLFIECNKDCPCGEHCRNQRFQRKSYADVEIFLTEKKGHGMRTKQSLKRGDFVMEYCGEVIPTSLFIKRTQDYHEQGKKHFYFMSLKSDEYIDAQRKGNLARFINHSCAPNCILHKWVVGSRLRIGLFTLKDIPAGSELTFDYKFERYGTQAQACYCAEPTCKGYIGGSKQTKAIEGLSEQPRLAHVEEDEDEEEETRKSDRPLETQDDVLKLIRYLMRISPSNARKTRIWLRRLDATQSSSATLMRRFVYFRGLLALKFTLASCMKSDSNLCLHVLKILKAFNFKEKNSVQDCKLDEMVAKVPETVHDNEVILFALDLANSWALLDTGTKIVKRKMAPPAETAGGVKRAADETDIHLLSKYAKVENSGEKRRKDERDQGRSDRGYDRKEFDRRDRDHTWSQWSRSDSRDSYNISNMPPSVHGQNNLASPPTASTPYDPRTIPQQAPLQLQYGMLPPGVPTPYDQHNTQFGSPMPPATPSSYTLPTSAYPPPPSAYGIPSSWASSVRSVLPMAPWEPTPSSQQTYTSPWDQLTPSQYSSGVNPDWVPTSNTSGANPDWEPTGSTSGANPDWVSMEDNNDASSNNIQQQQELTPNDVQTSPETPVDRNASVSGSGSATVTEEPASTPKDGSKIPGKNLKEQVANVVTGSLRRFKDKMSGDEFRTYAQKLTHALLDKEAKRGPLPKNVDSKMVKRIKQYLCSQFEKKGFTKLSNSSSSDR